MKNKPKFGTAIPKRRYRIGDYHLVVLGDIESDTASYSWVALGVAE